MAKKQKEIEEPVEEKPLEIEQESPTSPAQAHLTISGQDVEDYLIAQFPKKASKKRFHAAAGAIGRPE